MYNLMFIASAMMLKGSTTTTTGYYQIKNIYANGTHTADSGYDGFSNIKTAVPNGVVVKPTLFEKYVNATPLLLASLGIGYSVKVFHVDDGLYTASALMFGLYDNNMGVRVYTFSNFLVYVYKGNTPLWAIDYYWANEEWEYIVTDTETTENALCNYQINSMVFSDEEGFTVGSTSAVTLNDVTCNITKTTYSEGTTEAVEQSFSFPLTYSTTYPYITNLTPGEFAMEYMAFIKAAHTEKGKRVYI